MAKRALKFLLAVVLTLSGASVPNDALAQSDSKLTVAAAASKGGKVKNEKSKAPKRGQGKSGGKGKDLSLIHI